EDGLEHGLQVTWGTADDAENLGGRRLPLQRFAQLAAARLEFALVTAPPGSQQANKALPHSAPRPGQLAETYILTIFRAPQAGAAQSALHVPGSSHGTWASILHRQSSVGMPLSRGGPTRTAFGESTRSELFPSGRSA